MAAEVTGTGSVEVPSFLRCMPEAPEYHPTLLEFQDPVAYIFKIEKEASKYGICKIVPPLPASPRKTVFSNFNKSILARSNDPASIPTFTTRQQQIGFCPRKHRPVQKSVWQSGERYTLNEFEAKAKNFEKNYLRKYAKKGFNALEMETLFWNAMLDKPFNVEYANDMPGSAFMVGKNGAKRNEAAVSVGESEWNMRRVSRENLSLLRFMKEEIAGVTSPMVYVAMMFSWFAWHVEDHDFHSLNYLHMGSSKTWYGVPREASVAFEEVIREHGYGGEINPMVTFATLGKKTTVMSPEVLLNAGVPCCRLVQNAGDFVVTFPRAYHSGFSHGFNCGEAANIATPEWLRFAKEAAIRRAAINCPPMVSHYQLHYDLVLSLCSSVPNRSGREPKSSRLKDRMKGEGEKLVKELFLEDMLQNNDMLRTLGKGSSIILLPRKSLCHVVSSDSSSGFWSKSSMFDNILTADNNSKMTSSMNPFGETAQDAKQIADKFGSDSLNGQKLPLFGSSEVKRTSPRELGLFSCVSCGVICYACVAIVRPSEAAARYISSADLSLFNCTDNALDDASDLKYYNTTITSAPEVGMTGTRFEVDRAPINEVAKGPSSLGLLALAYDDLSDSEEEDTSNGILPEGCGTNKIDGHRDSNSPKIDSMTEIPVQVADFDAQSDLPIAVREHGEPKNICTMSAKLQDCLDKPDEDSSRLHVFCLEHALQVERRLVRLGGAHVFLACHPDYPTFESQAMKLAEELEHDVLWNAISFRHSSEEDEKIIEQALESENGTMHGIGDWAVKLGINLFYSANLSCSPLYSKQMHYNTNIYAALGRNCPTEEKAFSRNKRVVVAGKWCGKVWMSNQVHPLLANRYLQDEQFEPWSSPRLIPVPGKSSMFSMDDKQMKDSSKSLPVVEQRRTRSSIKRKRRLTEEFHESRGFDDNEVLESCKSKLRNGSSRKPEISKDEDPCKSSEDFPLSNTWKKIKDEQLRIKDMIPQAKRKEIMKEEELEGGYSSRLRKRPEKRSNDASAAKSGVSSKGKNFKKPEKKTPAKDEEGEYPCDMEGCSMSLGSKHELALHKRNICPVKGCGKKFFLHKYLLQHRRVHMDDRPLKCPWKGCKMTFKWAWARTEHIRVHTGERPYVCTQSGCGKTFRFVSDFSRHKRKTGHVPKKTRG